MSEAAKRALRNWKPIKPFNGMKMLLTGNLTTKMPGLLLLLFLLEPDIVSLDQCSDIYWKKELNLMMTFRKYLKGDYSKEKGSTIVNPFCSLDRTITLCGNPRWY
jgi:hypothetical protein